MSIVKIAPELAATIQDATEDATLEVADSLEWLCHYEPENTRIVIGTATCSAAWLLAYGLYAIYEATMSGVRPDGQQVDLEANVAMNSPRAALVWATAFMVSSRATTSWPPIDVVPKVWSPDDGETVEAAHVATELALCALAVLLHHEVAHHRLAHSPEIVSPTQEQEADYEAVRWILGNGCLRDVVLLKRALGVVIGFSLLMLPGIYTGRHGGRTHPRGFDRLVNSLDRHFKPDADRVWSFVVASMKLHLDNARIAVPPGPFDNFRECVDAYVEVLASAG